MREIKVRAWNKHKKEMIYIFDSSPYTLIWFENQLWLSHYMAGNGPLAMSEEYFELMQYTGLTDKNGKEIYEGDIVKIKLYRGKDRHGSDIFDYEIFKIEWSESSAQFRALDIFGGSWSFDNSNWVEIIGNLFENPEMMGE